VEVATGDRVGRVLLMVFFIGSHVTPNATIAPGDCLLI